MLNDRFSKNWYVLRTKSRNEKKVLYQIEQKQIEVYVPFIEKIRIWSDRKKKVQVPLFSGYVFVHGDEEERIRAVTNTSGAIRYIYFQNRPAIVSEREIKLIKESLLEPERISIEETHIRKGDQILVTHGLFKGMKGYVNEFRGNYRLTVNLEELSYSFSIILNSNEVELLRSVV